jgi:DNA (cytosine-5)-methyltransferase 1
MTNPRLTYEDFIDSLKIDSETPDSVAISLKIIGRELTEDDVQSDDVVSLFRLTLRSS